MHNEMISQQSQHEHDDHSSVGDHSVGGHRRPLLLYSIIKKDINHGVNFSGNFDERGVKRFLLSYIFGYGMPYACSVLNLISVTI